MIPKIIAVDFDGCLVTDRYPDIGEPIPAALRRLYKAQDAGVRIILWTCRRDERLAAAVKWCEDKGVKLAAVNENLPEVIEAFGGDTRKIYADVYIDDRAVNVSDWS